MASRALLGTLVCIVTAVNAQTSRCVQNDEGSFYDQPVVHCDGSNSTLKNFDGKVSLVVNIASF